MSKATDTGRCTWPTGAHNFREGTCTRCGMPEPTPAPVSVSVDVVRPGRGLITSADFSGSVTRDGGSLVVETEYGDVIGRTNGYERAAKMLARHHGVTGDVTVSVDLEYKWSGER